VIERAVYRSDAVTLTDIDVHPFHSPYENLAAPVSIKAPSIEAAPADANLWLNQPLKAAVWELKARMLEAALRRAKYNQKKAARILGLTYHQFRGLYRQYKIAN
jgi:psp operon transcriptional activator